MNALKISYKKKNYFFNICLVVSIVLSCICFVTYNSPVGSFLSKATNFIATPLQSAASAIYDGFSSITDHFQSVKKLSEENERLLKENMRLSSLDSQNRLLQKENDDLYAYLELKKDRSDFEFVNAKVIARSSSNYIATFTLDKGSFHGIKSNMPIIDSDGYLIGVVYSTDFTSSKCRYITSYDVNIGVYNENSGSTGILTGDFEMFTKNRCLIKGFSEDSTTKIGDRILTSGIGSTYPKGLILGTVSEIISQPDTHTKSAVVAPKEDLFETDNLMIISDFSRIYE